MEEGEEQMKENRARVRDALVAGGGGGSSVEIGARAVMLEVGFQALESLRRNYGSRRRCGRGHGGHVFSLPVKIKKRITSIYDVSCALTQKN
jgi:hypothetical protein